MEKLNPKDFRIGNLINNTYGNRTIICVVDSQVLRLMESGIIDNYSPIKLTPEILLKCGFIYDRIDKYYTTKNVNEFHIKIDVDDVKGFWIFFDNCPEHPITVVFNLHQLQNLYFALTGEELKINL